MAQLKEELISEIDEKFNAITNYLWLKLFRNGIEKINQYNIKREFLF